jgi:dihydroorotase (multifunctional complex type)
MSERAAISLIVDMVLMNVKAYLNMALVDCNIAVDEGRIFKIGKESSMPQADERLDLKRLLVLPGLIDIHVHLRDEGKAYKEDFHSGTAAAAAGGITTVLDMPNNDPVTMSEASLKNRMAMAVNRILTNVGFFSEFPRTIEEIDGIVDGGAVGFKLYMAEQVGGVDVSNDQAILEAFRHASRLGSFVAVHAEDEATLKRVQNELAQSGRNDIQAFLSAHSEQAEARAVKRLIKIAEETRMRLHVCHLSTELGVEAVGAAKAAGSSVTCEATPHHLLLSVRDLKRIGTLALTMPPVRERSQIEALWRGVRNGSIDVLASDHAPHTLKEKEAGSVWDVKVGVPGLETTLPLLLTEVNRQRLNIGDVVRLMSEKPAEISRLAGKGTLREGSDADLTVIDLGSEYKIDASEFHSKAKFSPFDGWTVLGRPVKTFVNGQLVMDYGEIVGRAGSGELVRRVVP